MYACLLFELINSKVDNEYEKLGTEGLTRREFAVNCVRSEFEAAKLTRLFFQVIPIDGAKVRMDDKYIEYVLGYGEFEAYLSWCDQLDDTQYNPVKYYGEVYDNYDSTRNEISANTNELLNTTRELLKSIREMVEE